tara:strand:+ start:83 stop:1141 length:1059 start_codon:yes stop_codon:yes gene_type:complete
MGTSTNMQFKNGIIFILIVFLLIWCFAGAIYPYILGAVIAYAFDPVVDKLESFGISRIIGTILICLSFLIFFLLGVVFIVPVIFQQLLEFFRNTPEYILSLKTVLSDFFPSIDNQEFNFSGSLTNFGEIINSKGIMFVEKLISSSLQIVNTITNLFIVVVVAFYLLLDWNRLIEYTSNLVPRRYVLDVSEIAYEIDRKLASFLRGQLLVCSTLSFYYSFSLLILGLQYGLLIGIFAGVISFIPFIGSIVGCGLAVLLTIFQFWDNPIMILMVTLVFVVGQILEGNILTPWLVGRNIGLHPVVLLFSISIFSFWFGITGLLIAVPMAAILGVIIKFSLNFYKETDFYKNTDFE